jgi:hypothetical protein
MDYAMSGTDTSMVLYVGASKLDGGYGAFNIELVSDGKYLTTGSDLNSWYAEGATGGDLNAPLTGSVLQEDHVYRITITRNGDDITVNYYDATDQKEYYEVTAKDINFGDDMTVHVIAQVGTFKIGQSVTVNDSTATATTAPTATPDTTTATAAPDVTAAPTQNPDETQAPSDSDNTVTPTAKPGSKVTVSGVSYKVDTTSQVTYTAKKADTSKVTIPATVKIAGKTYKVTSIAAGAFKDNKKLKSVTVSKNITKIGKNAFKGCKNLKTIVLKSKKLKAANIGKNAFAGISAKAVVKVPKSKVKAYTKLLRKKGLSKKVKVKAIK